MTETQPKYRWKKEVSRISGHIVIYIFGEYIWPIGTATNERMADLIVNALNEKEDKKLEVKS